MNPGYLEDYEGRWSNLRGSRSRRSVVPGAGNASPGTGLQSECDAVGKTVVTAALDSVIEFAGSTGVSYVVKEQGSSVIESRFPPVRGARATAAKRLGRVQISLLANNH